MNIAFVFPGQGSQSVGMLSELSAQFPQVIDTFNEASAVLQYDLWQIVQQGPEEKLNQTAITQPAVLAADIAVYRCWQAQTDYQPQVLAGHSLGEYAALVVAEVMTFSDAVALVAKRGEYMQAAVPAGVGAMAAIIGLDDTTLLSICDAVAEGEIVAPANFNSVGQTVIAGNTRAVERAVAAAKTAGAKIAKLIPVSVPSHCELMQPASVQLAGDLAKTHLLSPKLPVLHNVDVSVHDDIALIRELLVKQLTAPVRWVDTIQHMVNKYKIDTVLECGPGKVLTGLIKRIDQQLSTAAMGLSVEALQQVLDKFVLTP